MTNIEARSLVWAGRQVGSLLTKISATIEDWAQQLESNLDAEGHHAGSPLSNHTVDSTPRPVLRPPPPRATTPPLPEGRRLDVSDATRPRKKRRDCEYRQGDTEPIAIPAKSAKRVRVNWSGSENRILFQTLEKHASLGEDELLQEIVKALDGSRTRFQTKGRFRNLLASGKIRASETVPQHWIVMPGNFRKGGETKPVSIGTVSGDVKKEVDTVSDFSSKAHHDSDE